VPDLQSAPPPDLLFVMVKSQDTATAMEACVRYIPEHCLVLTLQNGLGNIEAITKHVPAERVLAGVSYVSAGVLAPGYVRHEGIRKSVFGPAPDGGAEAAAERTAAAEKLRLIFEKSGLPCVIAGNVLGAIWSKFMVNIAANPVGALTRLRHGDMLAAPESAFVLKALLDEGRAIARKKGINLEVEDILGMMQKVGAGARNQASTLQDVLAGRKTEILALNGALVREGEAVGIDAPFNRMINNLILMLERSYGGQV
jgi:2-dehydropantoate 2-reductase